MHIFVQDHVIKLNIPTWICICALQDDRSRRKTRTNLAPYLICLNYITSSVNFSLNEKNMLVYLALDKIRTNDDSAHTDQNGYKGQKHTGNPVKIITIKKSP